jgi:hypothetical protein
MAHNHNGEQELERFAAWGLRTLHLVFFFSLFPFYFLTASLHLKHSAAHVLVHHHGEDR